MKAKPIWTSHLQTKTNWRFHKTKKIAKKKLYKSSPLTPTPEKDGDNSFFLRKKHKFLLKEMVTDEVPKLWWSSTKNT